MNEVTIEIEFLGTGTSTGVPQLLCGCEVCHSTDYHDNRLRVQNRSERKDDSCSERLVGAKPRDP